MTITKAAQTGTTTPIARRTPGEVFLSNKSVTPSRTRALVKAIVAQTERRRGGQTAIPDRHLCAAEVFEKAAEG